MQQRRVNLPQLKMLLLVRSAALTSPPWPRLLLLLLLARGVAMATAERGPTCRQDVPVKLIRDLWSQTRQLISSLPKEENSSRRLRLLPRFCITCPERVIGWLEVSKMIDVYQRSVFTREVIQKLLPLHYGDMMYRLQHTLQYCVSSSAPSKWLRLIKKLEKKIKKKKRDEGAMKAVAEFTFILRWVDELMQHPGP